MHLVVGCRKRAKSATPLPYTRATLAFTSVKSICNGCNTYTHRSYRWTSVQIRPAAVPCGGGVPGKLMGSRCTYGRRVQHRIRVSATRVTWRQGPPTLAAERLRPTGGTTDFWPQSFHATPIGLMLKSRVQPGALCPVLPPFRRPSIEHRYTLHTLTGLPVKTNRYLHIHMFLNL